MHRFASMAPGIALRQLSPGTRHHVSDEVDRLEKRHRFHALKTATPCISMGCDEPAKARVNFARGLLPSATLITKIPRLREPSHRTRRDSHGRFCPAQKALNANPPDNLPPSDLCTDCHRTRGNLSELRRRSRRFFEDESRVTRTTDCAAASQLHGRTRIQRTSTSLGRQLVARRIL